MPLEIIRNDITRVHVDVIVNTANPLVAVGSGVDSAIYEAAGKDLLLAERAKIGKIAPGEAAATPAFKLNARYIIHTVGPAWEGENSGEVDTVALCYRNSLQKAKALGCESVAFPLLSSGTYGFPKEVALKTAISEISGFLFANDMTVYLVVYDKQSFAVSGKAFSEVRSYKEEREVVPPRGRYERRESGVLRNIFAERTDIPDRDASMSVLPSFRAPAAGRAAQKMPAAKHSAPDSGSLDDKLKWKEDTFQQHLFRI